MSEKVTLNILVDIGLLVANHALIPMIKRYKFFLDKNAPSYDAISY